MFRLSILPAKVLAKLTEKFLYFEHVQCIIIILNMFKTVKRILAHFHFNLVTYLKKYVPDEMIWTELSPQESSVSRTEKSAPPRCFCSEGTLSLSLYYDMFRLFCSALRPLVLPPQCSSACSDISLRSSQQTCPPAFSPAHRKQPCLPKCRADSAPRSALPDRTSESPH